MKRQLRDDETGALRKGVALMLASISIFAVLNGVVKDLTAHFPVQEIIFFRGACGLVPLVFILAANRVRLQASRIASHLPHVLAMTLTLYAGYTAFAKIPLAEMTALYFLQPVFVAVISHVFLGDRLGARPWIAVLAGFLGVLVIARPSSIGPDLSFLWGIAAALFGAIAMLQQRALSAGNDSLEIVFWFMAISALASLPAMAFAWVAPTPAQWLQLVGMGVASGIGQYLMILPLRYASASRLAPVSYTNLIGGIVVGFLWFGEVPDLAMLLGSSIVVLSTLIVLSSRPPTPIPEPSV